MGLLAARLARSSRAPRCSTSLPRLGRDSFVGTPLLVDEHMRQIRVGDPSGMAPIDTDRRYAGQTVDKGYGVS